MRFSSIEMLKLWSKTNLRIFSVSNTLIIFALYFSLAVKRNQSPDISFEINKNFRKIYFLKNGLDFRLPSAHLTFCRNYELFFAFI